MTYTLEYSTFKQNGDSIKYWGTIRVKNCDNEFHAKVRLEKYLKQQNPKVDRLVIHSCKNDDGVLDFLKTLFR